MRGGKRAGAGRKKGVANRINDEARKAALESGVSPLDYMLGIMRDEGAEASRRDDMAKAAAPYIHAKRASVEHSGPDGGPVAIDRIERIIVDSEAGDA